jgi:uncharacterized protein
LRDLVNAALAALLLSTILAAPLVAGPMEDADAAFKRGDYSTALQLLRSLAGNGVPLAQARLGVLYGDGLGVPKDKSEAVNWFRKAAEQGEPVGEAGLGFVYENGYGVPQDYAEAFKWYRKAAERGNAGAQFQVGSMYFNGEGSGMNASGAITRRNPLRPKAKQLG